MLETALDMYWLGQVLGLGSRARRVLTDLPGDLDFLDAARRGLLPVPLDRYPQARSPFPVPGRPGTGVRRAGTALAGRRVAVAASGGSGAMASLLGVLRAFEEAQVRPTAMTVSSGSALFGLPWATGRSADEVAEFLLGLHPRDYVDPDWVGLLRAAPALGRGFGGLLRGEALEATLHRFLGDIRLGDLPVPCYAPAWSIEENRVQFLGTRTTPDLPVARAIRVAMALPIWVAPVRLDDGAWCDGGLVDVFPVAPLLDVEPPPDIALTVNAYFPSGLVAEVDTGWDERALSLLNIESQFRTAQHLQVARQNMARLLAACPVVTVEPVPYSVVRGAGLYRQYVDTRNWPRFMLDGLRAGRRALVAAAGRT
ncbi:MAG TPA: patatin-like phospholipase family protein [Actinomycetes bacterium]